MQISLAVLRRSRTFWAVIVFFVAASIASGLIARANDEATIGFPFPIVALTPSGAEFYLLGLLLDAAITLTTAITMVWIVRLFRESDN